MSAPPLVLLPNTDLVAVAWLRRNAKFSERNIGIATTLPSDRAKLVSGFITTQVVGGSPELELPIRKPVVAVSSWAAPATEGSSKTPWPQAAAISEWIWEMTWDRAHMNVTLSFSLPGYAQARVFTVEALTEPRRVEDDPSGYARVDVDLLINWTGV
jgi:hypothetical protein